MLVAKNYCNTPVLVAKNYCNTPVLVAKNCCNNPVLVAKNCCNNPACFFGFITAEAVFINKFLLILVAL